MAAKPKDQENDEFQEAMKALDEACEELLGPSDSESGWTFFYPDWNTKMFHFKFSDGSLGSISFSQMAELRSLCANSCLLCFGPLVPVFDEKAAPPICLGCDSCGATYKAVLGKLCLCGD